MSDNSVTYKGAKVGTNRHPVIRALVPPSLEGAREAQTQARKRAKTGEVMKAKTVKAKPESIQLKPGTEITVVLPYPPVSGNHAVRHSRGGHYRDPKAEGYRLVIARELSKMGLAGGKWTPVTNLRVRLRVCPPDNRERDLDNMLKEFKDALTKAGFWSGDSNKVIKAWEIEWLPTLPGGAISMRVMGFAA